MTEETMSKDQNKGGDSDGHIKIFGENDVTHGKVIKTSSNGWRSFKLYGSKTRYKHYGSTRRYHCTRRIKTYPYGFTEGSRRSATAAAQLEVIIPEWINVS